MSDRLDVQIARLADEPIPGRLDGLEAEVARSIAARQRDAAASAALAPVRLASVGLALALGVTAGSAVATAAVFSPRTYGTFSASAHLAPSTLLEGRR
jgi:hypothetical protein